jgi:phosphohistidine phosphatase SixA
MIDRRTFLTSAALLGAPAIALWSRSAWAAQAAGPAEVLLMRHGEEPPHGPHLDDRGRARAASLVKMFPGRFAIPTALFATAPTRASTRSTETLQPLAAALHVQLDESFAEVEYLKLAKTILTKRAYAGGHVLICWHHDTIARLAEALGVAQPPPWPSKQYDHVWRLRYAAGRVTLVDEPEHLLPGDQRP